MNNLKNMIAFMKKYKWDGVYKFPIPGEHNVPEDYDQGIRYVIFVGYGERYVISIDSGTCTWWPGADIQGPRDIQGMSEESKRWLPADSN